MKNYILTLTFLLFSLIAFGQKITEKWYDKFNVQTIEVLGHAFSVGDTLTLNKGSLPNGEFVSTLLSPVTFINNASNPPHLPANYANYKFILEKIRNFKQGLNSQTNLFVHVGKDTPVWIDANLALTAKELLIK
jgi:hypothetical protein